MRTIVPNAGTQVEAILVSAHYALVILATIMILAHNHAKDAMFYAKPV